MTPDSDRHAAAAVDLVPPGQLEDTAALEHAGHLEHGGSADGADVDKHQVDHRAAATGADADEAGAGGGRGPSQSTLLVRLARSAYQLRVSPDGEAFALPVDGPPIARVLRGQRGSLRGDLAAAYYDQHAAAVSSSALADALAVVEGLAVRTTPAVPLHLRCAEHDDGAVWLDLGRADGAAARITPAGWTIAGALPLHPPNGTDGPGPVWRRTALTGELPMPVRDGRLDDLWALLNVGEAHRPLVTAWLVAALIPSVPVPILGVTGEQGTGKSSATRALVQLVDLSPAPLRTGPKDISDWIVAAAGSRVVGLDNLSGMPGWLSDALCRAVTGEGLVRRALFTDDDLSVLFFRRVIVLNGLDLGIGRGDLADRMIVAELDRIDETDRRLDADVAAAWGRAHPGVLGALLDLTAAVLAALPEVRLDTYPRMADYARVLAAVDTIDGTDGLATYLGQRDDLAGDLIAGDPLAAAVAAHVRALPFGAWTGTAGDLLDALAGARPLGVKTWPTSARGMSAQLTRLAPALRATGITIERPPREGGTGGRLYTLAPAREQAAGDRHNRHDRHRDPLTSGNTRDGRRDDPAGCDGRPEPGDGRLWPTVTQPGAPDQHQHAAGDGRDGCDGPNPSPPVRVPAATCIACRQPLTYDDGTHTHPACGGAA